MTLYICTAGTSIAPGPTSTAVADRIARKLVDVKAKGADDPRAMLIAVSAETNGLARCDCGSRDEVLLLTSDTDDGVACAEAVAGLVRDVLGAKARVERVPGLTVQVERQFRQDGVRNLLGLVRAAVAAADQPVVFNVTGGFKGVVPYLTLLGMFEKIEVHYVFDKSDVLIRLPPLPIRFDLEATAFAMPALLVLRQKGVMSEAKFRELLPGRGFWAATIVDQLVERSGDYVALTAAGELAVSSLQVPKASHGRLFVRRTVRNSGMFANQAAQRKLARLPDPLFRAIDRNSERMPEHTDLLICKSPSQNAPRLYYKVAGEGVFVVEILDHDSHMDIVDGKRGIWWADYEDHQYDQVDLSPAGDDPDVWAEELSAWLTDRQAAVDKLKAVRAVLDAEVERLTDRIARHRKDEVQLAERVKRAETELALAQRDRARLAHAIDFVAEAFRTKKRKDAEETPYINHLVRVAAILTEAGITDSDVLLAAYLHDAIEDVGMTAAEIEKRFGPRVRELVEEVSDDKSLPKDERKLRQVAQAHEKSPGAALIVLADKIANLRDLADSPPADWPLGRIIGYFDWAQQVVSALGDGDTPAHTALKRSFDEALAHKPRLISA